MALEIIGIVLFGIALLTGVFIIPFGVAGTFIIVGASFIYGLLTGFEVITLPFVGLLLGLAVLMEILEGILGAFMARRFGGSRWGMAGAIIGGFLGAIAGTPVVPVLGTLLGGFLGAFAGAMILEYLHVRDAQIAFRVGLGAFFGAVGGKTTKILLAIVMVIMIVVRLL
ncbi:MAG TPA: DUF456 domain-containing protein [bacterium]|nr:DUF456 domain-containing protein [bacterium]